MGNHRSLISVVGIKYAKAYIILQPTSNKLQPLDKCEFEPFKIFYSEKVSLWHTNNPGKLINIFELPNIIYKS